MSKSAELLPEAVKYPALLGLRAGLQPQESEDHPQPQRFRRWRSAARLGNLVESNDGKVVELIAGESAHPSQMEQDENKCRDSGATR